jgi:hypothetical protein
MDRGRTSPFRRRHIFAVAAGMLRFRGMAQSRSELPELMPDRRLSLGDETVVDLRSRMVVARPTITPMAIATREGTPWQYESR